MASIDKLFGTINQYHELLKWLKVNDKTLINSLYMEEDSLPEDDGSSDYTIANFSILEDKWLYLHCPLDFVINRISEQYDAQTLKTWTKERV